MASPSPAERVSAFASQRIEAGEATPFIVVDLAGVAGAWHHFRTALPRVRPFYAIKANPDRPMVALLRDLGASFDVASLGEIELMVAPETETVDGVPGLGVEPSRLIFANPVKRPRDVHRALELGVRLMTADCVEELDKIDAAVRKLGLEADPPEILVRIAVPSFGSMIDLSTKFGVEPEETQPLFDHARDRGLAMNLRGLAFHVGSQCINPTNYTKAVQIVMEVHRQLYAAGHRIDMIDIGGGFPVSYSPQVSYVDDVYEAVANALERIPAPVDVIAEPGRAFCATAATLYTSIIGRTERNGRVWYFIDDSIYHTFSGKIYDLMDYRLQPLGRPAVPGTEVVVAGCSCDGHDIITRQALLPTDLPVGSVLVAPNIGAYTTASSSSFNGFRPATRLFLEATTPQAARA